MKARILQTLTDLRTYALQALRDLAVLSREDSAFCVLPTRLSR